MTGKPFHPSALLAILLMLAALPGCSLLRLGYGQIDHIAAWMADDYFDLDAHQKEEFLRRFGRLHEWHRYQQLPEYAAFLGDIKSRVHKGLVRDDVIWITEGVKARYRTLVRHGAEDAAVLLLTVTPQQMEALQHQWDKDNARFVREFRLNGTAQERQRVRVERAVDQAKTWVGTLSHEQEQQIATMIYAMPSIDPLRHDDRVRRQREFVKLMAQRGNPAAFRERLQKWLVNWEEGRTPEYDRLLTEWWEKRTAYFVALERMLTAQQRATLIRRLQNHIDDFTRLAEHRGTHAATQ